MRTDAGRTRTPVSRRTCTALAFTLVSLLLTAVSFDAHALRLDWKKLNEIRETDPDKYREMMESLQESLHKLYGLPPTYFDSAETVAPGATAEPEASAAKAQGESEPDAPAAAAPTAVGIDQTVTVRLAYEGAGTPAPAADGEPQRLASGTDGDLAAVIARRSAAAQHDDTAAVAELQPRCGGGGIVGKLNCVTAMMGGAEAPGGSAGGGTSPGGGLNLADELSLDQAAPGGVADAVPPAEGADGGEASTAGPGEDAHAEAVLTVQIRPRLDTSDGGESFTLRVESRGRLTGGKGLSEEDRQKVGRDAERVERRLGLWQKYFTGSDAERLRGGETLVVPLALPFAGLEVLKLETPVDILVTFAPGSGLRLRFVKRRDGDFVPVEGPIALDEVYFVEARFATPPPESELTVSLDWGAGQRDIPLRRTERERLYRSQGLVLSTEKEPR